jgi:type I restriction enzyme S subunit
MGRSKRARNELGRVPNVADRYKKAVLNAAFHGVLTAEWRNAHPDLLSIAVGIDNSQTRGRRRRRREIGPDLFDPPFEIPPQWRWERLPALGVLDRGRSRHRPRNHPSLYGGPYPFVQTGDVKAAKGRLTSFSQTYTEAGLAQSRLWPIGILCITIAANIAETAILGIDACFPDSVVGFTANEALCDPLFVDSA